MVVFRGGGDSGTGSGLAHHRVADLESGAGESIPLLERGIVSDYSRGDSYVMPATTWKQLLVSNERTIAYPLKKYIIPIMLVILIACDDDSSREADPDNGKFEVTVISKQVCNLLVIEFKEQDIPLVRQITDADGALYHALQLSKIYIPEGQMLLIEFRKMTEAELPFCAAMGPSYPGIVLLSIQFKP